MESAELDDYDRSLIHALQIDGRAPFSKIAEVIGVSEQTVARRYRKLRATDVLRVVGGVDGSRLGYSSWTIRLRCVPDAASAIAAALARRTDTFWVYLLSGGTEISCFTQTRTDEESETLLLEKLPRTSQILGMTAHSVLRGFAIPETWSGFSCLTKKQIAKLRSTSLAATDEPVVLQPGDDIMLDILARDGRAGYAAIASKTGWSESTVKRRMDHLRENGILRYQLDISPVSLGYRAEARLWMSVKPSQLVSVATALASHPEVTFAAATTGASNLMTAVTCRNTADLYRYLSERIGSIDAIQTVETAPVIRTVKRIGPLTPQ